MLSPIPFPLFPFPLPISPFVMLRQGYFCLHVTYTYMICISIKNHGTMNLFRPTADSEN